MKKIKIKICNFNPKDTYSYGTYILKILQKYYDVELSEKPDYLFFNEATFVHLKFDCIKIFYTGENIHPNFNFCDYAFGFDYMNFEDRYYRLPIYFVSLFYRTEEMSESKSNNISDLINQPEMNEVELKNKKGFCSFVYSNYLGGAERKEIFEKLSEYKKVNSGGKYLNNIGKPIDNKLDFESKHKFSIAFENSSNNGYTTEKLLNSVVSRTIPIYWGNPKISLEFNTKRFVNCHDYKNFDEVLKRVIELDSNDSLYLETINQPFINFDFENVEKEFENFLRNIIDQPIKESTRIRINNARKKDLISNEKITSEIFKFKAIFHKGLSKIYRPFKKIKFLDNLKQKYFISKIK